MKREFMQFSYRSKIAGFILISAGIILAILFAFFNLVINLPVFAIVSSFLETKYFAFFTTNFTDELTLLLLLGGMFLVVFSKEVDEDSTELSEVYNQIRFRSMFKAIFYNTLLLLFTIFFVFGQGFFWILVINLISIFVLYTVIFEINKRHLRKT